MVLVNGFIKVNYKLKKKRLEYLIIVFFMICT